jgi:hypothetical protein
MTIETFNYLEAAFGEAITSTPEIYFTSDTKVSAVSTESKAGF